MAKRIAGTDTELALEAYASLLQATESMSVLIGRQLEGLGLSVGAFRVLEALAQCAPMTQPELCQRVGSVYSSVSFQLLRLEKRGLIVRKANARSRERRVFHLTAEGTKVFASVFSQHAGLVRAQMMALQKREQEILVRLCGKIGRVEPKRFVMEMLRPEPEAAAGG